MTRLADALTLTRLLVLAPVFVVLLPAGGWTPVVVFFLAAGSDFVDGPLSRRRGSATRYGGVLDSLADVVFVVSATVQGALLGRCPWLVPASIAASVTGYLVHSVRLSTAAKTPELARSTIGHWAGVANYVLVGLSTGPGALPSPLWLPVLVVASAVVILVNGAAVVARLR